MSDNSIKSSPTPSLIRRLNLLALIAFIPVALGLLVDGVLSQKNAVDDARQIAIQEVGLAVLAQQRQINSVHQFLATLSTMPVVATPDKKACAIRLRTLIEKLPSFANFGLLDESGNLVCSGISQPVKQSFSARSYFKQARDSKTFSVSEISIGHLSHSRSIIFGYPLYDSNQKFTGVLFAIYKDTQFANIPLSIEHDLVSTFEFYDRHGTLITTTPRGSNALTKNIDFADLTRARAGVPVVKDTLDANGKRYITVLRSVAGVSGTDMFIRGVISKDAVLEASRASLVRRSVAALLALLSGLALARWFLRKWLLQDLRWLVNFSQSADSHPAPLPAKAQTAETRTLMHAVVNMTDRLRLKQENLRLARTHLEALSLQLLDAQELERKSLARELHDELGQRLTMLNISLHRLRDHLFAQDSLDIWQTAETEVASLIAQVRTMSGSLRPPALDHLGLEAAIRQLLHRQFANTQINWILEYVGVPKTLPSSIEITAYRIIQESITNAVRHANAKRIVVEVNGGEAGNELEVVVRDDGEGFDVSKYKERQPVSMSSGLLGMSERVRLLGGLLNIESMTGKGTRIVASIPLQGIINGTDQSSAG